MGQPMEHVLRQCLIACGWPSAWAWARPTARSSTTPPCWPGWAATWTPTSRRSGSATTLALKADFRRVDFAGHRRAAVHAPPSRRGPAGCERARLGVAFLGEGRRAAEAMLENHWLAADGAGRAAGPGPAGPRQRRADLRALGRQGRARRAPGARRSCSPPGWSTWPTWSRCSTARAAPRRRSRWPRQRRGTQFDPQVVDVFVAEAEQLFAGLDEASSWDAVIGAEPALGARLADAGARRRAGGDRRLHRREVAVHDRALARAWPTWPARPRCGCGLGDPAGRRWCGGPGWCTTSAGWACPTRSGTSPARSATRRPSGCGCTRTSPSGCWPARPRWPRWPRSPSSTTSGWTAPATRAGCPAGRSAPRAGCWPPPTSTTRGPSRGRTGPRCTRTRRRASCGPRSRAGRMDGDAVAAVLAAAGHRAARRQDRPAGLTGREVEVLRLLARGLSNQADRRAAGHLPQDGQPPRRAHLRQDRHRQPGAGQPVRGQSRPDRRRRPDDQRPVARG